MSESTLFGKRYYAPALNRWVSADPLGVHVPGKADPNVYAYVVGAPLKNIDPVGLDYTVAISDDKSVNRCT